MAFLQPTVELVLLTASPDSFAQPSWTSQNLFSPQTYLLFQRMPVVQLLGLEELVLVNILFQLPVGSGSWHV